MAKKAKSERAELRRIYRELQDEHEAAAVARSFACLSRERQKRPHRGVRR